MRATGMDHIVLICRDVETTLAWWIAELGVEPVRLEQWRAGEVPFPSVRISDSSLVDFVAGVRSGVNLAHVALEVDVDGEALDRIATERGWKVVAPLNRSLFGARGVGAGLYVEDPDGTVVELRTYR